LLSFYRHFTKKFQAEGGRNAAGLVRYLPGVLNLGQDGCRFSAGKQRLGGSRVYLFEPPAEVSFIR
jgi:hypothetical protein